MHHICKQTAIYALIFFFFKGAFYYWQRNSESPYSSSKLIRHPGHFARVNNTGRGVPSPPSAGRLQLLRQCFFQAQAGSTQQHCNWLVRSAHADTLAPRPRLVRFETHSNLFIKVIRNCFCNYYLSYSKYHQYFSWLNYVTTFN